MKLKLFLFSLFLLPFLLFGKETLYLPFQGYLGDEGLVHIQDTLEKVNAEETSEIVMLVSSSSGDLRAVVNIAQTLYFLKKKHQIPVYVYINERAIGPAAILPFLADVLWVSPAISWGDIPYGSKKAYGDNLLRSLVNGLIDRKSKKAKVLVKLSNAMIDPHYQMGKDEKNSFEPLIANLEMIDSYGLVDKVLTLDEFFNEELGLHFSADITKKNNEIYTVLSEGELANEFKKYMPFEAMGENLVGLIKIEKNHPITDATFLEVRMALEYFKKKKVMCVLLHLDTPGGQVLASLKIADLLQKMDLNYQIPVIAFIDNWAVSAGAMLAYSCRFIGITNQAIMGAAEPVTMGQEGKMESAPEKVNSALRAEFANLASFFGRNPLIAEAMVDKNQILVLRNHQIIGLDSPEDIDKSGDNPDKIISARGKLLTLNAKELMEFGIADFEVPIQKVTPVTEKEEEVGKWPASKSLAFKEPYLSKIPNTSIISHSDWKVSFFSILTLPVISGLLFMGLIIGLYIEISTPGFGIPGSLALVCLVFILTSSFAIQAFNWVELVILALGVVLLVLELFVIPGFGITGIMGIILMVIGLVTLMIPGFEKVNIFDDSVINLVTQSMIHRLAYLAGAIVLSAIIIIILAKLYSHKFYTLSKLVLKSDEVDRKVMQAASISTLPKIGDKGEAFTPLRPSGKVIIEEDMIDAVTEGGFIEKGKLVVVVKREGSRIVVRELE